VPVVGVNTNGRTGLCLDAHDLCLAKLAAAREKDFRFVGALVDVGLIQIDILAARVGKMHSADPRTRQAIEAWITQAASRSEFPRL
jgi:hypothetical protein